MLCTVSTVKDTRANVELFVTRNLASGADHMFVFLEEPDDDTYRFLEEHPHVTAVVTDDTYWSGARPEELIHRQLVNANLVNCLVSPLDSVEWLVHLDGDECLELDKERLLGLDGDVRCVRLAVLEAVSTEHGSRDVEYFKQKLRSDQLHRLVELGVIEAPHNRHYFTGYLIGKAAARPGLDLDMGIHRVAKKNGEELEHLRGPSFKILHYDSVSVDEFVRKWSTHLSGGATKFREERAAVLSAIAEVLADSTADELARSTQLREIYKRHVETPIELLLAENLLVRPRAERHRYVPTPFPAGESMAVEELMRRLLRFDKARFRGKQSAGSAVELMRELRNQLWSPHRQLAKRIDAAIDRALPRLTG